MDLYAEIVRLRQQGRAAALATIIQVRGSIPAYETAKLLVRDDGTMLGTVGGGCVEADVWQAARQVMEEQKPRRLTFQLNHPVEEGQGLICGGALEVFIEPILAQPVLIICGGGHVGRALSRAAVLAGFDSVILDDRPAFASRERFPEARDVFTGEYEALWPGLPLHSNSYLAIATRGHQDDLRLLRLALASPVPARYIGMIGSRRKVIEIFRALAAEGVSDDALARVHAPIGLEIGAVTPEEIAAAIVAEMIAVRRQAPLAAIAPKRLTRLPSKQKE